MLEASTADMWSDAIETLRPRIKSHNYDMWLRPIQCLEIAGDRVRLRAPNRYIRDWFEDNYLQSVLDALRSRTGRDLRVSFEDGARDGARDGTPPPLSSGREAPPCHPALNAKYLFENFVAGPSNQLAHGAARGVADSPGHKWNPLFLYGGVGLGKTHLCQAIGHQIYARNPRSRVIYVSAERFMNEFVAALRGNEIESFRTRYREQCDVLLIDDVQALAGRDRTQDEFFHTFNALYDAHRQIVLTSDSLPNEIGELEERLKSRFSQGLIADVQAPDIETKIAILQKKAEADAIGLPDDVAQYIASTIRSNVRELEGALVRVAAHASLSSLPITVPLSREALAPVLRHTAEHLTVETVQKAVATYYNVKVADLRGPKRHRAISVPRQVAMYLSRKLCDASYPDIGNRFGGKDHTTVITAYRKIGRLAESNSPMRNVVQQIERTLTG